MRPPVLPSGNRHGIRDCRRVAESASMRPPVLPSGNHRPNIPGQQAGRCRFNEAAGFTQRKLSLNRPDDVEVVGLQ